MTEPLTVLDAEVVEQFAPPCDARRRILTSPAPCDSTATAVVWVRCTTQAELRIRLCCEEHLAKGIAGRIACKSHGDMAHIERWERL